MTNLVAPRSLETDGVGKPIESTSKGFLKVANLPSEKTSEVNCIKRSDQCTIQWEGIKLKLLSSYLRGKIHKLSN